MRLLPYTATALAESDADGTNGKNIVEGATVSFFDVDMNAVLLYDDDAGANPSTAKLTGANGQVTVFIEAGEYTLSVNGTESKAVVSPAAPVDIDTFANLQLLNPAQSGQRFVCFGRSNANYILQDSGYVAKPGDAIFANGRIAELQIKNGISPEFFGADQLASDNSVSLQSFFERIFLESRTNNSVNVISNGGVFEIESGIEIILNENHVKPLNINLNGIAIIAGTLFDNVKPLFSLISAATNRNISINDGCFDGNNIANKVALIDGGDKTLPSFLYNIVLARNVFRNGIQSTLEITGNFFESSLIDNHGQMGITTGRVFEIINRPPNAISSIEIRGGSTRGGLNGLYTDIGDVKIYGGTYIESGGHGIECINGNGAVLSGIHVENNFVDGTGSNNAGILVTGAATIERCLATSTNGIHDTLISLFASSRGISMIGAQILGGVSNAAEIRQGSGKISFIGVNRSECFFPDLDAQRVTSFAEKSQYQNNISVSGSVTPDFDDYDVFNYSLVADVTIENPINAIAGDKASITIRQDAIGGHTVTLGSQYRGSPVFNTAALGVTALTYVFNGGVYDLLSQESY